MGYDWAFTFSPRPISSSVTMMTLVRPGGMLQEWKTTPLYFSDLIRYLIRKVDVTGH